MRNRFVGGLVCGILVSLLIFNLVACGGFGKKIDRDSSNQIKIDQNLPSNVKLDADDYTTKVDTLTSVLDYYYYKDLDEDKLKEGIYKGLVNAVGDVYTVYYTKEEYEEFEESNSGVYAGIGSSVSTDVNGNIVFIKPFEGGPAANAGILPGDILTKINDEDCIGMDLNTAVTKMKGEPGTTVNCEIYREGEYIKYTLVRAKIEVPTVESLMLDPTNKIGYIAVSSFDEVTDEQFIKAVDDLESQGMASLIVDLRDNPGGMLTTVNNMLSRIVPKGELLVYMEDKYGRRETYNSKSDKTLDIPIVVLINGNSASASEVFSGCLQSYKKAVLMGTQSFGKGIVQSILPLEDGSAVKVTVSSYFTPNDVCIHGVGLTPDQVVELDKEKTFTVGDETVDNQVNAAVEYLKGHK